MKCADSYIGVPGFSRSQMPPHVGAPFVLVVGNP